MSTKELIQAEVDTLSDEDLDALYIVNQTIHLETTREATEFDGDPAGYPS